jgi:hypothetical protein
LAADKRLRLTDQDRIDIAEALGEKAGMETDVQKRLRLQRLQLRMVNPKKGHATPTMERVSEAYYASLGASPSSSIQEPGRAAP